MARGGGGGADRFQAMAAQRDAMQQKVIDSLDRLTAALGARGAGPGGAGAAGVATGGGAGTVAAQVAATGAARAAGAAEKSFWETTGSVSASAGLSAMQKQLAASASTAPAAAILGGLSGGVPGVVGAFAGMAAEAFLKPGQSQYDAFKASVDSSSPIESELATRQNADRAAAEGRIRGEDSTLDRFKHTAVGRAIARAQYNMGAANGGGFIGSVPDERSQEEVDLERQERIKKLTINDVREQMLARRLHRFSERFDRAGAVMTAEQVQQLTDVMRPNVEATIANQRLIIDAVHGKPGMYGVQGK